MSERSDYKYMKILKNIILSILFLLFIFGGSYILFNCEFWFEFPSWIALPICLLVLIIIIGIVGAIGKELFKDID